MIDLSQPIIHKPLCPVRTDVFAEGIMLDKWRGLMGPSWLTWEEAYRCPLSRILTCEMNPRAVSVAASLIRWIGTNCGRAFMHEAKALLAKVGTDAYLLQWVRSNKRSNGPRLIEHLLATPADFGRMNAFPAWGLKSIPTVTTNDHEVLECIFGWFGSEPGQLFIEDCETAIKHHWKKEMEARRANPNQSAA